MIRYVVCTGLTLLLHTLIWHVVVYGNCFSLLYKMRSSFVFVLCSLFFFCSLIHESWIYGVFYSGKCSSEKLNWTELYHWDVNWLNSSASEKMPFHRIQLCAEYNDRISFIDIITSIQWNAIQCNEIQTRTKPTDSLALLTRTTIVPIKCHKS